MLESNLFIGPLVSGEEEFFHVLLDNSRVKIERIVSHGHRSPKDFWYDQETNEWVGVLKGRATLIIEGETDPVQLGPGSYIIIPAHTRHRVEWTDPNEDTVWLTVHY